MNTMRTLLIALLALIVAAGCSAQREIRILQGHESGDRCAAGGGLADRADDARATDALLAALQHQDAGVRWHAVEALGGHLERIPADQHERRVPILRALAERLGDSERARWCKSVGVWPFQGPARCAGSTVRCAAYGALVRSTSGDYGLDAAQWHAFIDRRYGKSSAAAAR